MKVTVEGILTSVELKEKDDKKSTELLLAQAGEVEQVKIRINGDTSKFYKESILKNHTFSGRLMTWSSRNGVGSMVLCDGN